MHEAPSWLLEDKWPIPKRVVYVPDGRVVDYVTVLRREQTVPLAWLTPDVNTLLDYKVDHIRLAPYRIKKADHQFLYIIERLFGYDPVECCIYTNERWHHEKLMLIDGVVAGVCRD